jgi:hypothetical protein
MHRGGHGNPHPISRRDDDDLQRRKIYRIETLHSIQRVCIALAADLAEGTDIPLDIGRRFLANVAIPRLIQVHRVYGTPAELAVETLARMPKGDVPELAALYSDRAGARGDGAGRRGV